LNHVHAARSVIWLTVWKIVGAPPAVVRGWP